MRLQTAPSHQNVHGFGGDADKWTRLTKIHHHSHDWLSWAQLRFVPDVFNIELWEWLWGFVRSFKYFIEPIIVDTDYLKPMLYDRPNLIGFLTSASAYPTSLNFESSDWFAHILHLTHASKQVNFHKSVGVSDYFYNVYRLCCPMGLILVKFDYFANQRLNLSNESNFSTIWLVR